MSVDWLLLKATREGRVCWLVHDRLPVFLHTIVCFMGLHHVGLEPILMTLGPPHWSHFTLITSEDSVSNSGHVLRSWRLGLKHMEGEGGNLSHRIKD